MCYLKVNEFTSSEQAFQWRFMTYIGLNKFVKQIIEARYPDQAKKIDSHVSRELHRVVVTPYSEIRLSKKIILTNHIPHI